MYKTAFVLKGIHRLEFHIPYVDAAFGTQHSTPSDS